MTSVTDPSIEAPASYDIFFKQYYGYVVRMVRKLGISEQDKEDVASAILIHCLRRDIISMFDSNIVIEHRGQRYQARFQSFLNSWVVAYVRHHREQYGLMAHREPLVCDAPVGDGSSTMIDVYGPQQVDDYSYLEEEELVASMRAHLVTVPRRSKQDVCDLPLLFDAVVAQVRTQGRIDAKALTDIFGVSPTAIHSWLGLMRIHVRDALTER